MSLIIGLGQGGMQPSTPTIGTATAGASEASVAFTPSTYIGKSTIVYRATSNPGGFSSTSTTSPITVTGLTNGTAYTFTVRGETPYGVNSLSSAASNSVTPAELGVFESLATVSPSGQTAFSFTSIPSTYKYLQIHFVAYGNTSDGEMFIRFNGDAGNNYGRHWFYATMNNDLTTSGIQSYGFTGNSSMFLSDNFGITATTSEPFFGSVYIGDYTSTTKQKTLQIHFGRMTTLTPQGKFQSSTMQWANTAAITSISFTISTSFGTGTKATLYGVKI